MRNQVSRWLKAGALMFVAVLVIAACEGPVGVPGKPGQPGQPGGVSPRIDEPIPDLQLEASGEMATRTIDLNDHFSDPDGGDGEALTFAAISADTKVVTADVSGSTLTLKAVAVGTARITVRATDGDDLTSGADRFDVTVAVTVEPGSVPPPPEAIDEKGTISDVTVKVDETETVNVADNFTFTEGVSYEVDESNANATATVDTSGRVSITGKKVGQLNLTVTATDARDNEAMQTIAVTVTPAGAKYKPRALTIEGVGIDEEISLDEGQRLESRDQSKVTVAEKSGMGNIWTITAKEKGTVEVRIWNENQTIDQLITVTVENTDPKKKGTLPDVVVAISDGEAGGLLHVTIDDNGVYTDVAAADVIEPGAKNRWYHFADVKFAMYFDDKDGFTDDIPEDGFKAKSNEPDVKVVGMPTAKGVAIDVMRDTDSGFPLVIYVMDKDGGKSEEVTIIVGAPTGVIADLYEVTQVADTTGGFSKASVWLREDVTHTLTFADYDDDDDTTTLRFANLFTKKLTDEATADESVAVVTGTSVDYVAPTGDDADASVDSDPYYTVEGTGPIELVPMDMEMDEGLTVGTDTVPTLMFKVTGSREPATVIITYHVSVSRNADADDDADIEYEWEEDSKTLTMNIVSSS